MFGQINLLNKWDILLQKFWQHWTHSLSVWPTFEWTMWLPAVRTVIYVNCRCLTFLNSNTAAEHIIINWEITVNRQIMPLVIIIITIYIIIIIIAFFPFHVMYSSEQMPLKWKKSLKLKEQKTPQIWQLKVQTHCELVVLFHTKHLNVYYLHLVENNRLINNKTNEVTPKCLRTFRHYLKNRKTLQHHNINTGLMCRKLWILRASTMINCNWFMCIIEKNKIEKKK